MKHVERRHFFVREAVQSNRLVVPFVRTADNLADFFIYETAHPEGVLLHFAIKS